MDKLMAQFIEEARELINNAGQSLLALEKTPKDTDLMDQLFRDVHTLKGSAGVLELNPVVQVVHEAEELFELAKDGEMSLDADCIDLLLDSMDLLNGWIDSLDASESLPGEADTTAKDYAGRLAALKGNAGNASEDDAGSDDDADGEGISWGLFDETPAVEPAQSDQPGAGLAEPLAAPEWISRVPESSRLAAFQAVGEGKALWCISFSPESDCFFRGDDPLFMARQTPGLLALDVRVRPPEEGLAVMDVFSCQMTFGLISQAEASVLDEHFQYESDTVTREPLLPETLIQPIGPSTGQAVDEAVLADLKQYWEQQQTDKLLNSLQVQQELLNPDSREASLMRWLSAVVVSRPDDAVVFDTLINALEAPQTMLSEQRVLDWPAVLDELAPDRQSRASVGGSGADLTVEDDVYGEPQDDLAAAPEPSETGPDETQLESAADNQTRSELALIDEHVLAVVADQRRLLELCQETELRVGAYRSAQRTLLRTAMACGASLPDALVQAQSADELQQALVNWLQQTSGSEPQVATGQPRVVKREPSPARPDPASVKAPANTPVKNPVAESPASPSPAQPVIRSFKVDQEQVENLGDLVGELVVAKNALPFLAQRAEQIYGERQLGREIREQFNVINRITRALQDAMMEVQMLPVSHVFGRFPRLVRDLSRKLDKPIDLVIEGEDTEAEKHVIESLADPLVHLMRNSIDHGIESRDKRQASGKSETGRIGLSAWQENESVVIEVKDDGGGIDPEKTRLKAYEKGLLDERRLKELTDKESVELIFLPGFSTLEAASDLSGRGVGMDVVRTTIEKAGGRIDVQSEIGKGTRFRMTLPLSMSISQVMQIWIGGQRYGVPMDQVAETVRLPADRIHRFKDRETVMLRDRVLPVSRAREQLDLETRPDDKTVALLVVRYRGELVALVVDDFSEGVEVILKPMEGTLENLGVYQGTALLGDGSVLLVLNLGVLLSSVKLEEMEHDRSGER